MRNPGILTIFELTNIAESGSMPVEKLVEVFKAYYEERTIGINRVYAALGADQQIDMLVRIFYTPTLPTNAEYVILEDGLQYRITLKQKINADTFDLTLVRLEDNYDVQTSDT
jgi:SPP1 family predicted phage head-tail adaptor